MAVAPINCKLYRLALVIILDRPIVMQWHQTSGEEVVVMGLYD